MKNLTTPPEIAQAELAVIGSVLDANGAEYPPTIAKLLEHAPESFDDPRLGQIAVFIRKSWISGSPVSFAAIAQAIDFPDSLSFISLLANEAVSLQLAEDEAKRVWTRYRDRRTATTLDDSIRALQSTPHLAALVAETLKETLTYLFEEPHGIREILETRKFNFAVIPPPVVPRYLIGDTTISTPGNVTTVFAPPKGGKTALIGGMLGAAMSGGGDLCLSIRSENKAGGALIHLDTEQSIQDHDKHVRRAIRRAGLDTPPVWFHSYCLTGLSAQDLQAALRALLRDLKRAHGSIHSVIIDGVADMVVDVNDATECNSFVAELHALAIEYDCSIICVIHLNPGQDNKTRGHLGSQLERKSESNIRLEPDGAAIICWADKNRHAPILKSNGPRFIWSDEAGMHVLTESAGVVKDTADREKLQSLAEDIYADRPAMRHCELQVALKEKLKISDSTAERKVSRMKTLNVIQKAAGGLYVISTPANTK